MADTTGFRGVIVFLEKLGVYDVVLPFLLVFTIVFAILEKTRVLGTDDIDGKPWPKKNLNAVVAFVVRTDLLFHRSYEWCHHPVL